MNLRKHLKLFLLSLIFSFFSFAFFSSTPAFADTFTISGHVQDSLNNAITNATVSLTDVNTNANAGSTTTDGSGNYSIIISSGTYNVQVTPPSGSTFSPVTAYNQVISSNTILNFTVEPASTIVTLNGHVSNAQHVALQNQYVTISNGTTTQTVQTDQSGAYQFQVPAGQYSVDVSVPYSSVHSNPLTADAPVVYALDGGLSLAQNITTLDITLPTSKVIVHVQDQLGHPVSGVTVNAKTPSENLSPQNYINLGGLTMGTITGASGTSFYPPDLQSPQTDGSGNATLWLFPNNNNTYTIVATPASGSNYQTTTVPNTSISSDTTLTVTLPQTPQQVSLNGHIFNAQHVALQNQYVTLSGTTTQTVQTDQNGAYQFQVPAGQYGIEVSVPYSSVHSNPLTADAPVVYALDGGLSLAQNITTLDITLPTSKVIVHVQDQLGHPVSGVTVNAKTPSENLSPQNYINLGGLTMGTITAASGTSFYPPDLQSPQTDGSGNVTLWLFSTSNPSNFTYTIVATPPSGSNYQTTTVPNTSISGDTTLTVTLPQTPQQVTLNVNVSNTNGIPLSNQQLTLSNSATTVHTQTDASGNYKFQVPEGQYELIVYAPYSSTLSNPLTADAPVVYALDGGVSLTQNTTTLNIKLPAKKITVHVQDQSGNPVTGVTVNGYPPTKNLSPQNYINLGGLTMDTITGASGTSFYPTDLQSPQTDGAGNATLWLFPNHDTNNDTYTILVSPPSGSIFSPFTLNNLNISSDQTEIISLQYNHALPVTTIDLATQHSDATYSNPTTVTLSATADIDYTIVNTYYKVDGGSQQTYTSPFTVTGSGDHSIEYWSVDNSGVQESHHTKTFTIYQNLAPYVNPLSDAFINQGGTYSATGSFTDSDSTSWTATVDYGDGPVNLPLNSDKTFSLSHQYNTAGIYTITVVVKDDGGATGTTSATVTVNAPPQIIGINDTTINYQDDFTESGSFTDPDSSSWTATVNYGDLSGDQNLPLNGTNFTLDHLYPAVGTYIVTVKITDNQGATGTKTITVLVNAPPHINPLTGATINEGQTYTETGSFADSDSISWTATVNYDDGGGPENLPLNPDKTFTLNHLYKDNKPNNAPYTVTVSITDNQGAIGTQTTTVAVNNVVPTVSAITASVNPIQVNTSTMTTATFTDAGVLDTHIARWTWNDGSTTDCPSIDCTITEANGSGTVTATHTYTVANVYTINLRVTDKDGGSGDSPPFQYLSVYNPTPQGLFSGARLFTSPAGAYAANPSLTGQVQFGITAKYQNNLPTGNVSMKFNAAGLTFTSTGISVLVTANGKATLMGTGTVNGSGNYNFLVTGVDSTTDVIRFQITDSSNTVVYDSQMGAAATDDPTAVVTGQVVIH